METVFYITHPDVLIDLCRGGAGMAAECARSHPDARDADQSWVSGNVCVASSTERKAVDGAAILGAHLGLRPVTHPGLGENDRSSTGYLAKPKFEAMADAFFAHPEQSVAGWERAVDAQMRIIAAMRDLLRKPPRRATSPLWRMAGWVRFCCAIFLGSAISRAADQPCRLRWSRVGLQPCNLDFVPLVAVNRPRHRLNGQPDAGLIRFLYRPCPSVSKSLGTPERCEDSEAMRCRCTPFLRSLRCTRDAICLCSRWLHGFVVLRRFRVPMAEMGSSGTATNGTIPCLRRFPATVPQHICHGVMPDLDSP